MNAYERWGTILATLAEISDMERQLVLQAEEPGLFVPDELVDRWFDTFRGGHGLGALHLSEAIVSTLIEFDFELDDILDVLPEEADDKEAYIRYDEVWSAIREMADITLRQLAMLTMPEETLFEAN